MIELTGRYGEFGTFMHVDDTLSRALDRLIDELCTEEHPIPDLEHESISVSYDDTWCLSAKMSGLVTWGRLDADPANVERHQRDIPRAELHSPFMTLAAGKFDEIERLNWKSIEELPPFKRDFFLYANYPLKSDLHKAAHLNDLVWAQELIEQNVDLELRDEHGATPLHCAVLAQHPQMCQLLIDAGADVNRPDIKGATPLDYGHTSDVRELIAQRGGRSGNNVQSNN